MRQRSSPRLRGGSIKIHVGLSFRTRNAAKRSTFCKNASNVLGPSTNTHTTLMTNEHITCFVQTHSVFRVFSFQVHWLCTIAVSFGYDLSGVNLSLGASRAYDCSINCPMRGPRSLWLRAANIGAHCNSTGTSSALQKAIISNNNPNKPCVSQFVSSF